MKTGKFGKSRGSMRRNIRWLALDYGAGRGRKFVPRKPVVTGQTVTSVERVQDQETGKKV